MLATLDAVSCTHFIRADTNSAEHSGGSGDVDVST